MTEYTAGTARVTILPGGGGTDDIGNSLRQLAQAFRPRVTVLIRRPLFCSTHNAAQASGTMACDPEESDDLRKAIVRCLPAVEKEITMTG